MLSRSNSTMSSSTNTSTTAGPGAGPSRPRKRTDHIPSLTLPELSPVPLNDLEAVDKMLMRCDEAELEGVVDRERRRWQAMPEELFARPVSPGSASPASERRSAYSYQSRIRGDQLIVVTFLLISSYQNETGFAAPLPSFISPMLLLVPSKSTTLSTPTTVALPEIVPSITVVLSPV
jgi:hypothetical protein